MNIHHDVVYVGMRLYPCGGTKVIADHIRGLGARGIDAHLVCLGMFASAWFDPSSYTEIPGFRGLDLTAQVIVTTSALVKHLLKKARYSCKKYCFFMQGDESEYYSVSYPRLQEWTKAGIEEKEDELLVPSAGLASYIKEKYNKGYRVVWPFLEKQYFYPGPAVENFHESNSLRVLLVGNLDYKLKGLEYAYQALDRLRGPSLQIVRLSHRPLFPGETCHEIHINPTREEIGAIYRSCHLLIYPSLSEGFGLPVLEAMSCGIPVITSYCIGMRGWVHGGCNALVVKSASGKEIGEALQYLWQKPEMTASMIKEGLRTSELFSEQRTINRLIEIYNV